MIQKKLIKNIAKKGVVRTGTLDHATLNNRNIADQHVIGSITGLQTELDKIGSNLDKIDINRAEIDWNADKIDGNVLDIATNTSAIAAGYVLLQTNIDNILLNTTNINTLNLRVPANAVIFKWEGDWAAGTYQVLAMVRHNNKVWYCVAETTQEPKKGNNDWEEWKNAELPTDLATMTWVNDNYASKNAGTSNTMEGDYLFKGKMTSIAIPVNNPDVANKEYADKKADKSEPQLIQALWNFGEIPKATAIANSIKPADEKDFITLKWLNEKVNFSINDNREYITNELWNGETVYIQNFTKGDVYAATPVKIASSGDLISGIKKYQVISGLIRRDAGSDKQIHNIANVSNLPDQHTSVIYQSNSVLRWYYNSGMTLSQFLNASFEVLVKYTKV